MNLRKSQLLLITLAFALAACDGGDPDPPQTDTVTFGSRLVNEPANNGECENTSVPCTIVGVVHFPDPDEPPDADGAPVDGVITTFRVRAHGGDETRSATLVVAEVDVNANDDEIAEATVVATGPTVSIPPFPGVGEEIPILEFEANLPVSQGQYLGIEGTGIKVVHNSGGSVNGYWFSPPLVEGEGASPSNADGTGEVLIQADITFEVE